MSSAVVSTTVPLGKVTLTVEFASAVPVTRLLLLVTSLIIGASGAFISLTVVVVIADSLPALSVEIALNSSPPSRITPFGILTVKLP